MNRIVIAIDGYSGCGKSSTAKALARRFGYKYIDSGAMYRGVTHLLLEDGVDLEDLHAVEKKLESLSLDFQILEDGSCHLFEKKTDLEPFLRTMQVNRNVSKVSAIASVREKLVAQQQQFGTEKGIVMDGRDIGTVVFPHAELKLFLTADVGIRAARRQKQLMESGLEVSLEEIIDNFKERDRIDTSREVSPLTKASDAIEIDTSHITFEDQVDKIVELAENALHEG
ncbi:MAG: (d)CMP kinase [Bacteroidota bacterium]